MITTRARARFELKKYDEDARTFEGLAAAYSVDDGGDEIQPGAFKDTLASWKANGRVIPLMDHHASMLNPTFSVTKHVLGSMVDAAEMNDGLWAKFRVADTAAGNDLLSLLRGGHVDALSIGYNPPKNARRGTDGRRKLASVDLKEVSVVPWGLNPDALIDRASVKALQALTADDPGDLDDETRRDLRVLASRIGNLLKTAPAEAADATEPEATQPDAAPDEAAPLTADPAVDMESKALLERIQNIIGRTEP